MIRKENHGFVNKILIAHPLGAAGTGKVHRRSQFRKDPQTEIILGPWMGHMQAQEGTTPAKKKHFVELISLSSCASTWLQFVLSQFVWLSESQKGDKNGELVNAMSVILFIILCLNLTVTHTITVFVTVWTEKKERWRVFPNTCQCSKWKPSLHFLNWIPYLNSTHYIMTYSQVACI